MRFGAARVNARAARSRPLSEKLMRRRAVGCAAELYSQVIVEPGHVGRRDRGPTAGNGATRAISARGVEPRSGELHGLEVYRDFTHLLPVVGR
jgi:hypothetical protein